MRLIDADLLQTALMDEYVGIAGHNTRTQFYRAIEIVQQQPNIIPPPSGPPSNAALTLEQLREMDGEPVWVVELNGYPPHWGLVYWYRKNKRNIVYVTISNGASICAEAFMAAGGKIYRRKPEEGTP